MIQAENYRLSVAALWPAVNIIKIVYRDNQICEIKQYTHTFIYNLQTLVPRSWQTNLIARTIVDKQENTADPSDAFVACSLYIYGLVYEHTSLLLTSTCKL